jgi:c-di-GMP-binding flagellar brake protein YcgR
MPVEAGALIGIALAGERISLYGRATLSSAENITIQLKTPAASKPSIRQGQSFELTAVEDGRVSLLTGEMVSLENMELTLGLRDRGKTIFRRASRRVPCSIPVEFRGATVENASPWQKALVNNMSQGGMSIVFSAGAHVPKEIEVRFPNLKSKSDSQPVRLSAQILRRRPLPDGELECGVAYSQADSHDLNQYIENLFGLL